MPHTTTVCLFSDSYLAPFSNPEMRSTMGEDLGCRGVSCCYQWALWLGRRFPALSNQRRVTLKREGVMQVCYAIGWSVSMLIFWVGSPIRVGVGLILASLFCFEDALWEDVRECEALSTDNSRFKMHVSRLLYLPWHTFSKAL